LSVAKCLQKGRDLLITGEPMCVYVCMYVYVCMCGCLCWNGLR